MSNLYAPFRYDYVGSFLRPAELKKARADYEAGAITADAHAVSWKVPWKAVRS